MLPPARAGVGSAVNDATRELGGTLGVAVVGLAVLLGLRSPPRRRRTFGRLPAAALAQAQDSVGAALDGGRPPAARPGPAGRVHGRVQCGLVVGLLCLVGAVGAFWLPGRVPSLQRRRRSPPNRWPPGGEGDGSQRPQRLGRCGHPLENPTRSPPSSVPNHASRADIAPAATQPARGVGSPEAAGQIARRTKLVVATGKWASDGSANTATSAVATPPRPSSTRPRGADSSSRRRSPRWSHRRPPGGGHQPAVVGAVGRQRADLCHWWRRTPPADGWPPASSHR